MIDGKNTCFVTLIPNVSERELATRKSEAAARAKSLAAKIRAKVEEEKLPEVVKVE